MVSTTTREGSSSAREHRDTVLSWRVMDTKERCFDKALHLTKTMEDVGFVSWLISIFGLLLALDSMCVLDGVSNASNQKYPTQSSESPQSSNQPSIVDNCQMDTGSTSTDNLIESLTNTLALLNQSFKAHLPQINNQLRTSSNARNKAPKPFQRNNARGNVVAGNVGGQNRVGNMNPGQAKPIMCYNCKGIGHIARESDQCDASRLLMLIEAPTTQTMFMANLSSEDPIYDEVGPSYDSNTPFEVQDHDTFVDHMDEYHEYVKDNGRTCCTKYRIFVRNDALLSILDEMHEQGVQSIVSQISRKKTETSVPKPLSALTVYPPNTPVKLVLEFFNLKSSGDYLYPTQRRQSGIAFRDSFIVSKKRSSDSSKKLKGIQTLTPAEQEAADIMKALKESKKMSKRQPGTGGSNEGTGNILGVPDESTVISRASSEGTGSKPGVPDEEKLIL
ncbi:hypothetical protein Tco_1538226 [Tanacetum coccineum]